MLFLIAWSQDKENYAVLFISLNFKSDAYMYPKLDYTVYCRKHWDTSHFKAPIEAIAAFFQML